MLVGVVMCDDLAFSTVKQKGMMSRGDVYMYHKQVVLTRKPIHIFYCNKNTATRQRRLCNYGDDVAFSLFSVIP